MNDQLSETPWLSGEDYSIADISLVVYLTRMSSFQMAPLWQDFSYLQSWFEKIKGRDAYKKAIDNWGDITAEKRKVEGQAAFETVKLLWEEPSE